MNDNCLVTGGTGFIGAEVMRLLAGRGDTPVAFDLHPNEERLSGMDVSIEQGDLGDGDAVETAVIKHKPDVIYHFGGMLSVPSEADHVASFSANATGTLNVLKAALKHSVRKVVYSSSMISHGQNIENQTIDDDTLQRPNLFYGATKVFSEHMGIWFQRKYGIDFRGLRYPGIVGPGVKTPGVAQYNAWMIEAAIKREPFTAWVREDTRHAILYYKDAAKAAVQLADAPKKNLKRSVYVLTSQQPSPSAGELAETVKREIPGTEITFEVDPARQKIVDDVEREIDDGNARREWGFEPEYDLVRMISDMRETIVPLLNREDKG
ncbi:MAG: NAD-dependent epimerase/dehydratase family protein [Candidatus Latescibacterota bacterium]|nr:NAD-dependent epimerase/dehydratase family protein [Candidatus Latescibacterota bacterium]